MLGHTPLLSPPFFVPFPGESVGLTVLGVMCSSLVVTGASDGIGREFAIQLAKAGFNILLAARNQAKLDAVVDDIGAFLKKFNSFCFSFKTFVRGGWNIAKACGNGGESVQTKTFIVDFASADDARWEALLEELKPIDVGVLGASLYLTKWIKGRADIVMRYTVNNVGASHEFPTDFVDTPTEELTTIVNVNITATLRVTSLIAPSMVSRSVSSLALLNL